MRMAWAVLGLLVLSCLSVSPARGRGGRFLGPQPDRAPIPADDWSFWWRRNAGTYEDRKRCLHHRAGGGPVGASRTREDLDSGLVGSVQRVVIPALLEVLDAEGARAPHVEASVWLALAKVTGKETHVRRILGATEQRRAPDPRVMESVVFALGLLRRGYQADCFRTALLDEVREALFGVLEDDASPSRVRGFSALALGLLGDQPCGSDDPAEAQTARHEVTVRLFDVLQHAWSDEEVATCLFVAIGLQSPSSVHARERDALGQVVAKGLLGSRTLPGVARAWAALALGRVGTSSAVDSLARCLYPRLGGEAAHRSAAIALGLLARRISSGERVKIAAVLRDVVGTHRDVSTRSLALISLGHLLAAEIESGTDHVLGDGKTAKVLLRIAGSASGVQRSFAALALGLVARAFTDDVGNAKAREILEMARRFLRATVCEPDLDVRMRAACCVASGLARDGRARGGLLGVLGDTAQDENLRAVAAWGLGLGGVPTRRVCAVLGEAATDRGRGEVRRHALRALALLGHPALPGTKKDAVDVLLEDLASAPGPAERAEVVVQLAHLGDRRALDPLVRILRDREEDGDIRALVAAALGAIGDLEVLSALDRLRGDSNYRAETPVLREVFGWL